MDLSKLVDYDQAVPVTIHKDDDGEVIFSVRSIDNPDAQRLMSKRRAGLMGKRVASKSTEDTSEDDVAELLTDMIDPPADILATCVTSWEWNGHTFGKLGKNPKFITENVTETLRYKWIKDKVQGAAQNIENFTQA